ncbi:Murein DD-endopeptidase MepM [compost metagenome]
MATGLLPDSKEEQDSRLNPGNLHAEKQFNTSYSNAGIDQLEAFANDPNNTSQSIKDQEAAGDPPVDNGFYRPGVGRKQEKVTLKGFFKKKGPMATIIALIIGGGGAFSIMLAPGLGIIQLKEALMEDLNDQLAAVDARSMHVLKAKIKGIQAGASICSDSISIRCKFSGLGKKQLANFEKAGFTIEGEDRKLGGKTVTKLTFTEPAGSDGKPGRVIEIKNPNELQNLATTNNHVRKALVAAYNPRAASISDRVATLLTKGKGPRLTGSTPEEFKESIDKTVKESTKKTGVSLAQGDSEPQTEEEKKLAAAAESQKNRLSTPEVNSLGSIFSSAAKGVSITGAVDTACTVKNTARAVAATSKIIRSEQLIAFVMVIFNTADRSKAGDPSLTPEMVSFVGDLVTATDTEKEIYNESSKVEPGGTAKMVANPDYGKNAFDSAGIRTAMYNDAPSLSARAQQYTVGGGLVGTLSTINAQIDDALGKNGANTCKIVQNPLTRLATGVIGIVVGIGSGGASLAVSVGASLAIGAVLPILEARLASTLAGTVVNGNTKGVDAGNAMFAGAGSMLGGIAQKRGMKPATMNDLKAYTAKNDQVKNEYIALDVEAAKKEPLNIYNQYSFLGSLARSINPTLIKSSSNVSSALTTLPTFFSTALTNMTSKAGAAEEFNPERFSKCLDAGYQNLGISADIFCNVRYAMSDEEMNLDTDEILNYMIDNNFIDDAGEPVSGRSYANWKAECADRAVGWGEIDGEDPEKDGMRCMQDTYESAESKYFRAYTMDRSLQMAMDEEQPAGAAAEATPPPSSGDGSVSGSHEWPIKAPATLSRCYLPVDSLNHYGIDIAIPEGTSVHASDGGTVMFAGWLGSGGYGNAVFIDHGNGQWTEYDHNASVLVKTGDKVSKGQEIAKSGNTGNSFGAHLHWQINKARPPLYPSTSNTIDPLTLLSIPDNQRFTAGVQGCR